MCKTSCTGEAYKDCMVLALVSFMVSAPNSQLSVSVVGKDTEQVEDPTAQRLAEAVVGSTEVDFALDTGLHTGLVYTGLGVGNTGPEWAGTGVGWCTGKTVRKDAHQDLRKSEK